MLFSSKSSITSVSVSLNRIFTVKALLDSHIWKYIKVCNYSEVCTSELELLNSILAFNSQATSQIKVMFLHYKEYIMYAQKMQSAKIAILGHSSWSNG